MTALGIAACAALLASPALASAAVAVGLPGSVAASGSAVKCIDDLGDSSADGAPVVIWTCDGSAAQRWTVVDGTLRINGECFETVGQGSSDGTPVDLGRCDGSRDQQWVVKSGALVSALAGKCLADPDGAIADGTRLVISTCDGGANQDWTRAQAPVAGSANASAAVSSWLPAALVALVAAGLGLVCGLPGASRRGALVSGALRSRRAKRRRPVHPAVASLLADPATVDDAVLAFAAAGRAAASWPYAVAVSTESATVWVAGFDVPEPAAPWQAVPGDSHAWTIARSELPAAQEGIEDFGTCPVLLGSLDDSVVVLDVSRSHGVLVIGGDPRMAARVKSSVAGQLDGGEVVLREDGVNVVGGRPHWAVDVDSEGWITVHGRQIEFARATQLFPAPESAPADRSVDEPASGSAFDREPESGSGPVPLVDRLPAGGERVGPSTGIGNLAVSALGQPLSAKPAETFQGRVVETAGTVAAPPEEKTEGWGNTAVSSTAPKPQSQD